MSGSGASNMGYGNSVPNSNVNPALVNVANTSYAAGFSSNEIPQSGLFAAKNNVDAANAFVPSLQSMTGGRRRRHKRNTLKAKIKNIARMYKMKRSKRKSLRRRLTRMASRHTHRHRKRHRRRTYRGGYSQYQNNMPLTQSYSLGGNVPPGQSAMANPPPYSLNPSCANCADNYNHFLGSSFQSSGWGAK